LELISIDSLRGYLYVVKLRNSGEVGPSAMKTGAKQGNLQGEVGMMYSHKETVTGDGERTLGEVLAEASV
jgi:hypothetical protein